MTNEQQSLQENQELSEAIVLDSLADAPGKQLSEDEQKQMMYLMRNRKARREYFKLINKSRITKLKDKKTKKTQIIVSKDKKMSWRDDAPKFSKQQSMELSSNIGFIKGWRNPEKLLYEN